VRVVRRMCRGKSKMMLSCEKTVIVWSKWNGQLGFKLRYCKLAPNVQFESIEVGKAVRESRMCN
jgi:hypothetical protein